MAPLFTRESLKHFFKKGKFPSEVHFSHLIDSSVNKLDDGFAKSEEDGLQLAPQGKSDRLISFFKHINDTHPEWQINFGFDYELPVGDNMRLVLANDNQYSSSFLTILGRGDVRPETVQPDALMIDLGLTLYGEDDRWQIGVYGKNLTDKLRPGYCSSVDVYGGQLHRTPLAGGTERSVFGRNEISCSFAAGRAIQVSFGLKY